MLTMLVQQHPDGDAAHEETVQEVLHILAGHRVHAVGLFVLHHPLGHGGDDVIVSVADLNDSICETGDAKVISIFNMQKKRKS